ncbi:MAG: hypothetical protein KBF12_04960 [Sebaldella sp.]|nr:hypothetical protein [Sebaldella sp.]
MDLDKMDERIKKAEEETRESARREKSLRDAKRKYKESEILKLLRKNNLIEAYDSKNRQIFEKKFQELKEILDKTININAENRGI